MIQADLIWCLKMFVDVLEGNTESQEVSPKKRKTIVYCSTVRLRNWGIPEYKPSMGMRWSVEIMGRTVRHQVYV